MEMEMDNMLIPFSEKCLSAFVEGTESCARIVAANRSTVHFGFFTGLGLLHLSHEGFGDTA